MATTTINFATHPLGFKGQEIDLTIIFTHDGSNNTVNAEDFRVLVTSWGKIRYSYDIDDPLMVPGTLEMAIYDPQDYLYNWFFGDPGESNVDRRPSVQLDLNGSVEYKGRVATDAVRYLASEKLLVFTVTAESDIINKISILDDDDAELNPFSYTSTTYYTIIRYFEDIFQEVNSAITHASGKLEISHGWDFRGEKIGEPTTTHDFTFDELLFEANAFYFKTALGSTLTQARNCGELLRRIARDYGAFVGLLHNERAFFKQLFRYDSGNTQTLETYEDTEESYQCNILDYVRVWWDSFGGTIEYDEGTFTIFDDLRLNRESLFYFFDGHGLAGDSSLVRGVEASENYQIQSCKYDPVHNSLVDHGDMLAKFWYYWLQLPERCKVKKFIGCKGVDYDFLKDFTDGGENFNIFFMEKDFDRVKTTIHAFNLGS